MTRWVNRILLFLNVCALIIAFLYFGFHGIYSVDHGIEYKDLVTIILTAIAVLLAAVTLFVAAMAIWGYNSIREESVKAAVKAADAKAAEIAKNVAESVASREAIAMLNTMQGAGQPGTEDELAVALRSVDGKGSPKP